MTFSSYRRERNPFSKEGNIMTNIKRRRVDTIRQLRKERERKGQECVDWRMTTMSFPLKQKEREERKPSTDRQPDTDIKFERRRTFHIMSFTHVNIYPLPPFPLQYRS